MPTQAVIFDLFGTIVDDFSGSAARYQQAFSAALGIPHEELTHRWRQLTDRRTLGEFQTVEASIEHVCTLLGATVTPEQMMNAVECRLNLTRQALQPRHDALATFQQLKSADIKIGLLSNCSIEIPIVWPETQFAEWFDATTFSARERVKKPAAEIYQRTCQRLGVDPDNCIYVADGENFELTAARNLGMQSVLIKTSEPTSEVRREAREWKGATVATLSEILKL